MASTSESSFGKRLDNAKALSSTILSFGSYTELNAELSLANLNNKVQELLSSNADVANKLQTYSITIEAKQNIFTKKPNAISKIVTLIVANVRSIYGKSSKEAENVNNLITKKY